MKKSLARTDLTVSAVAASASLAAAMGAEPSAPADAVLIEHSFIGVGFVSSTQKPQALVLSFESGYKMLLDTSRMEVEVRRVDGTVRP